MSSWFSDRGGLRRCGVALAVAALLLLLAASRLGGLDARACHHDESIHAYYAWKMARQGPETYRYDPVYHGPFLYHFGALFQRLLPDTLGMARVPYGLAGLALGLVFLLWRRLYGVGFGLLAGGLILVSPTLAYFSRFARNDVYMALWMCGAIAFGVLYLERGRLRWLTAGALALALAYATKENSYVHHFALCFFLLPWGVWRVWRAGAGRRGAALGRLWTGRLALARLLWLFALFSAGTFLYVALDSRLAPERGLAAGLAELVGRSFRLEAPGPGAVEAEGGSGFFSAPGREAAARAYRLGLLALGAAGLAGLEAGALWARGLRGAALAGRLALAGLLYALGVGYFRALTGWVSDAAAGSEFLRGLALWLGGAALAAALGPGLWLWRAARRGRAEALEEDADFRWATGLAATALQCLGATFVFLLLFSSLGRNLPEGPRAGLYDYLAYWFRQQTGAHRIWGPWWYHLPRLLLYEALALALCLTAGALLWLDRRREGRRPLPGALLWFFLYLALFLTGIYALLHEKVPWLTVYPALGWNLLAAGLVWQWWAGPGRVAPLRRRALLLALGGAGLAFTLHQHGWAVYRNDDDPSELLVYTGTTPEFHAAMQRADGLRRAAAGRGESLTVALDGEGAWPGTWYFRNDEVLWGRVDLEAELVVCDDRPARRRLFEGRRGRVFDVEALWLRGWWLVSLEDPQAENGLPGRQGWWANVGAFLTNAPNDHRERFPESERPAPDAYPIGFARQVWDYILHRRVWYPTGGTPVLVAFRSARAAQPPAADELAGLEREPLGLRPLESVGGPQHFREPRGLARLPGGGLGVADSKNGRVALLDAAGRLRESWGADLLSGEYSGVGDVEPGPEGSLFVADTWNGLLRRFDATGRERARVGVGLEGGREVALYGPRGLAFDAEAGRLFVTDTGNGAVRVYGADLRPLYSFDGAAGEVGALDEPVGIALGPGGEVYVADAGNGCIQVFDRRGGYLRHFQTLRPEAGVKVALEPQLLCLEDGRLLASYSLYGELWLIDPSARRGRVLRVARPGFREPLGLAADGAGGAWVGDRASGWLVRLALPPREELP